MRTSHNTPATIRWRSVAFSASSRLLDLNRNSEVARFKQNNISAAMAADVKRFGHEIKRTRFSAHTAPSPENAATQLAQRTTTSSPE